MRRLAVLALVTAGTAACLHPSRGIGALPGGEWLLRLGDARHAAFADEHVPFTVRRAWDEGLGRGLPAMPIIQEGLIIAVVSGGGIVTASAETGDRYWTRRFNGSIAGQVLRVDNRIFFATQHRNGSMYALDVQRGRRLWSRRLDSRASAEPAYADGRVYLATDRGDVMAFNAADGTVAWRVRIGAVAIQPPVVLGDELIVPVRDSIVRMQRSSGSVRARVGIAGTASAPLAVHGDTLTIAMHPGVIASYVDRGATELWRHELPAPVLAAPVVTAAGVYALTRAAELFRLSPDAARLVAAVGGTATESLTITANGALVGLLDGSVVFVLHDGTRVWEERLTGSVRAPAAVRDSDVFVTTLAGRLVKLTS